MKITHLLFDLDNTLYPSTAKIDEGITHRMLSFTANLLGVSYEEAVQRRIERLPLYGTTLEWLRTEHGLVDVDEYFSAVHPPEEVNELQKDVNLRPLLKSLGLPMTILTNAPRRHAVRVLEFLEIADFQTKFDGNRIVFASYSLDQLQIIRKCVNARSSVKPFVFIVVVCTDRPVHGDEFAETVAVFQ